MWFISPPVAEHKEWGVLLTLGMAQSQPSHAQVGMRNTLCPWEMSRQELLKPWLSSAEFPVHTLKFCTLLKVSPEKPALHICSYWGSVRTEQMDGESLKAKWDLPSRRKAPFPLQQKRQRCPAVTQAGPGDLQGSGLCLAECGEQLVHSKCT